MPVITLSIYFVIFSLWNSCQKQREKEWPDCCYWQQQWSVYFRKTWERQMPVANAKKKLPDNRLLGKLMKSANTNKMSSVARQNKQREEKNRQTWNGDDKWWLKVVMGKITNSKQTNWISHHLWTKDVNKTRVKGSGSFALVNDNTK